MTEPLWQRVNEASHWRSSFTLRAACAASHNAVPMGRTTTQNPRPQRLFSRRSPSLQSIGGAAQPANSFAPC